MSFDHGFFDPDDMCDVVGVLIKHYDCPVLSKEQIPSK